MSVSSWSSVFLGVSCFFCDSALRPCFVGLWGLGLVGYPRGCQACVVEKAALLVCPLDITESHWSLLGPSGLGKKHHLSFQLFLYLWSLGMYLVTAAAGQWWASSQVHRGFQASWSWGSGAGPCSLRQKSPQPPPPATTVCAPTHLWFSALRGRLVTEVGAGQRWGHHLLSKRNVKGLIAGERIWIYWA